MSDTPLDGIMDITQSTANPGKHWKAYSTLVGGTLFMMYVGCIYITGNI